jgi:hypothetical protein
MDSIEAERNVSDSSFRGPPYPINELERIISKRKKKKGQFDRNALNELVIRVNHLFLPKYIEGYIDILEQDVYAHDYLAMLIIIGGHIGGLEINSRMEINVSMVYRCQKTGMYRKNMVRMRI